ncbi:hypothetical protein AAY473_019793 [Plecturocebus cupreus]
MPALQAPSQPLREPEERSAAVTASLLDELLESPVSAGGTTVPGDGATVGAGGRGAARWAGSTPQRGGIPGSAGGAVGRGVGVGEGRGRGGGLTSPLDVWSASVSSGESSFPPDLSRVPELQVRPVGHYAYGRAVLPFSPEHLGDLRASQVPGRTGRAGRGGILGLRGSPGSQLRFMDQPRQSSPPSSPPPQHQEDWSPRANGGAAFSQRQGRRIEIGRGSQIGRKGDTKGGKIEGKE